MKSVLRQEKILREQQQQREGLIRQVEHNTAIGNYIYEKYQDIEKVLAAVRSGKEDAHIVKVDKKDRKVTVDV